MSKPAASWLIGLVTAIVGGCVYAEGVHVWDGAAYAGLIAIIGTSIKASLTQTPQDAKTAAGETLLTPGVSMTPFSWTTAEGTIGPVNGTTDSTVTLTTSGSETSAPTS